MSGLRSCPVPLSPWATCARVLPTALRLLLGLVALLLASAPAWAGDPPARVGRISFVQGEAELALDGSADWRPALLNMPVTSGAQLRTPLLSRAELRIGSSSLQLNVASELQVLQLDDNGLVLNLRRGNLVLTVRPPLAGERVLVQADGTTLTLTGPASLHLGHHPGGRRVDVKLFEGSAQLGAQPAPLLLAAGQHVQLDSRTQRVLVQDPLQRTRFDDLALQRAARADRPSLGRLVSAEMTGADELDGHGRWRDEPRVGPVWYPNGVDADWAPFRAGQWRWVPPWGWTWVDDAPWGFAPSHYGRWLFLGGRWGWVPGPLATRPVYAPALVGFYGPAQPGQDLAWVGWFPLAPGEAYRPPYAASPAHLQALNAGQAGAPATGNHRYAQTSFAATAVAREAFGQPAAAGTAARVTLSPATLSATPVLAAGGPPAPGPAAGPATAAAMPVAPAPHTPLPAVPAVDHGQGMAPAQGRFEPVDRAADSRAAPPPQRPLKALRDQLRAARQARGQHEAPGGQASPP